MINFKITQLKKDKKKKEWKSTKKVHKDIIESTNIKKKNWIPEREKREKQIKVCKKKQYMRTFQNWEGLDIWVQETNKSSYYPNVKWHLLWNIITVKNQRQKRILKAE